MNISEKRAHYPLQEKIKIHSPDSMARKLSQSKLPTKLVVHGINILNKTSVDSDTAITRIKRRRETHNRVERRRRDHLNRLMMELSELIPQSSESEKKCHRAKLLALTIDHIRNIQNENNQLRSQLGIEINLSESSDDSDTPVRRI
ncbi:hypothetical protein K501DRAFT_333433 [Backusella circina FSU 941]|nr:hypothetical protein K501DRAFT_333433 [Backusella circina FSU 941]